MSGEQGHGDMMQFARYARALAQMGATVDMWVPENIVELIQSVHGVRRALTRGPTAEYDYWTPSMSVPSLLFHDTASTLPSFHPRTCAVRSVSFFGENVLALEI